MGCNSQKWIDNANKWHIRYSFYFFFFPLVLWKVIFRSFLQRLSLVLLHRRQTATITNGSSYFHLRIWVIIIFGAARVYLKILCSAARTPLAIFQ